MLERALHGHPQKFNPLIKTPASLPAFSPQLHNQSALDWAERFARRVRERDFEGVHHAESLCN